MNEASNSRGSAASLQRSLPIWGVDRRRFTKDRLERAVKRCIRVGILDTSMVNGQNSSRPFQRIDPIHSTYKKSQGVTCQSAAIAERCSLSVASRLTAIAIVERGAHNGIRSSWLLNACLRPRFINSSRDGGMGHARYVNARTVRSTYTLHTALSHCSS